MSQQPESTSHSLPASPAQMPGAGLAPPLQRPSSEAGATAPVNELISGNQTPPRIPPWLETTELFLRVLLRIYVGVVVCVVPWLPFFWDQNFLFTRFPSLSTYATNGAVRGLVTGLGLLNLWIAFRDVVEKGKQ
jgi:hypothetical protein